MYMEKGEKDPKIEHQSIYRPLTAYAISDLVVSNLSDKRFSVMRTEPGLNILDTAKPSERWVDQRVVYISNTRRNDGKVYVNCTDPSIDIPHILHDLGVSVEKKGEFYLVNTIGYSDLTFPELTTIAGEIKGRSTYYNNNGVTVFSQDSIPNNVYAYYGKNQLARVVTDEPGKTVQDVQRTDDSLDMLKLAIALNPEMPFREHIMRRFNIDPNSQEIQKIMSKVRDLKKQQQMLKEQYNAFQLPEWEMTDPEHFDPDKFRLIVHMLARQSTQSGLAHLRTQFVLSDRIQSEGGEGNAIDKPDAFLGRKYISASVIDQLHTGTWDDVGVILGVPNENIVIAAPHDVGTLPSDTMGYKRQDVIPATDILQRTTAGGYNEVVVHGTNPATGAKSKILGVVVITNPITGKPKDLEMASKVKGFAMGSKLPIVEIPAPIDINVDL